MEKKAEVLRQLLSEMLDRLTAPNVGNTGGYQNQRRTNGKAEGKPALRQQLN